MADQDESTRESVVRSERVHIAKSDALHDVADALDGCGA
jgi:hypothetical protein